MSPREQEILNGYNEIGMSSQFALAYLIHEIGYWFENDFVNFWEDDFVDFWE